MTDEHPLKLSKDGHLRFACLMMANDEGKPGKDVVNDAASFYDFITAKPTAKRQPLPESLAAAGQNVLSWTGTAPRSS